MRSQGFVWWFSYTIQTRLWPWGRWRLFVLWSENQVARRLLSVLRQWVNPCENNQLLTRPEAANRTLATSSLVLNAPYPYFERFGRLTPKTSAPPAPARLHLYCRAPAGSEAGLGAEALEDGLRQLGGVGKRFPRFEGHNVQITWQTWLLACCLQEWPKSFSWGDAALNQSCA